MNRASETVTFAGCPVDPALFAAWEQHWAHRAQPFFVSDTLVRRLPPWPRFTRGEFRQSGIPLSLHDTFKTYDVVEPPWVLWLTYEAFAELGYAEQDDLLQEQRVFRRAGVFHLDELAGRADITKIAPLVTGAYFVWWPRFWKSLQKTERYRVLRAFVESDRLPCRRSELSPAAWRRVAMRLPGARDVAGSFLPDSGGNCLATVMAAFGASAVADRWIHPEPFERWLGRASRLSEHSAQPPLRSADLGRVLVWRDEHARVQHAAVSLGAGYILHKEAQGWYAPRQVSSLEDVWARWQDSGRLSIYEPTVAGVFHT
jgi:hypothetical protein